MKPYEIEISMGPVALCSEAEALAPASERPDARVVFRSSEGEMIGHVALWWRETPKLEGEHIGAIGGFHATNSNVAVALLNEASSKLRNVGCQLAVGPMNGNTWRRHRFVVESSERGYFLLEPRNSEQHPGWWQSCGFIALSRYSSSAMNLDTGDAISPAITMRLKRSGVRLRKMNLDDFNDELVRIYTVSVKSFANNYLYTPLDEFGFMQVYHKLRDRIDPDLVMIAERGDVACGFVFGILDLEAVSRSEKPALIVKTLAVDPEARCAGLGSLLVDELHRSGREKGFTESIHALQHETNTSLKITGRHHGKVFRRYSLFSKKL